MANKHPLHLFLEYIEENPKVRLHQLSKIGRNPKKADIPIIIPKRYALKFTPAPKLKKLIEG